MKKILIFILIITTSFVLTSCNNKDNKDLLRVGIDLSFYPFMYLDEENKATGLEPDLAREFADYLNMEVEIVNTGFPMLIPGLQSNDLDVVISDMTVTEDRAKNVSFSNPYRFGKTVTLVNKDFAEKNNITDDMDVDTFFSLKDLKAVGVKGTIGTIIPMKYNVNSTTTDRIIAIAEVANGTSNVCVGSYTVFGDHNANQKTTIIYKGIPDVTDSAFVFKKGNTLMVNKANDFIKSLYLPNGIYSKLAEKYDEAIGEAFFDSSIDLSYIVNEK